MKEPQLCTRGGGGIITSCFPFQSLLFQSRCQRDRGLRWWGADIYSILE